MMQPVFWKTPDFRKKTVVNPAKMLYNQNNLKESTTKGGKAGRDTIRDISRHPGEAVS